MSFHLHNLHFSASWLTFLLGLAAWIAVVVLAVIAYRRSTRRGRTLPLEAMRVLAATGVFFMLLQPEWRTELSPTSSPAVLVLYDDSHSMTTEDANVADPGQKPDIVTRAASAKRLVDDTEAWAAVSAENDLIFQPFGTPPETADPGLVGTDIFAPIDAAIEDRTNLRAIVLISDGDATAGPRPVVAAQKMSLREVPLYTLATGATKRLPDIDLLSVTAPTYGIIGENVQIPFTVRSSLDRDTTTTVRLRDKEGREVTKPITLPARSTISSSILWRLEQKQATLTLSIPVARGELVEGNNDETFTIAGREESIKVLVVETRPRWEYRFIRNALSRDPGVDVDCLLFHPQLGVGGGPDYIAEFPSDLEQLQKYDVVILGDVGIGPDMLTAEQAELIKGLVENQASGVVFIPGTNGHIFSLIDEGSPLADLIPVQLDGGRKGGIGESIASDLDLTKDGSSSLLTMLADTEDKNPGVWRSLPGFYWHAPVQRQKGGATVLAVHKDRRNEYGRIPLIVTRSAGYGKVLFMGIDSAWRWRRGVEDLYHYRFWGQVARWMSYQRNIAAGERIRLYFTPEKPSPGDTVSITANAFDDAGAPLQEGTVMVDITAPDGVTQRIQLEPDADAQWGTFAGQIRTDIPGEWSIRAFPSDSEEAAIESDIIVQGNAIEKIGQPTRPDVLEELARIAKGRALESTQLDTLITDLKALPDPKPLINRLPLWSHWLTATTLIALLSLFWLLRKLNGTF